MNDKEAGISFNGPTPEQRMMAFGVALGDLAMLRARVEEELRKPRAQRILLPPTVLDSIDNYTTAIVDQRNRYLDDISNS